MQIIVDDGWIAEKQEMNATKIIKKAIPFLMKEFSLPKNIEIYLQYRGADDNGKICLGEAVKRSNNRFICILNLNNQRHSIVDTLGHEFTHIEQMYQCRLAQSAYCFHWMTEDKKIITVDKATTYEAYKNYPWEIEARKRGRDFKKKYSAVIDPTIMDRIKSLFGLI